jgi:hypothetical protein
MSSTAHTAMPISLSHLAAGTPWWIYGIVIAVLALHIGGGLVAILSGYGAVTVRKGGSLHLRLGKVFVGAMLVMASIGTVLSIMIHQPANIGGGILSGYLVATGWVTVRRKPGIVGRFEKVAALVPVSVSVLFFVWGVQSAARDRPLFYSFAAMAALFALIDFRVIWQGGVSGVQRLARHLWRMCFGLFFAAASFFLGQQKVMPAFIHGSPILWVLGLAPLGFMIFWLIRVRRRGRGPGTAIVPQVA